MEDKLAADAVLRLPFFGALAKCRSTNGRIGAADFCQKAPPACRSEGLVRPNMRVPEPQVVKPDEVLKADDAESCQRRGT